ncbi:DNA repair protein RecO [Patescibacteria group bacterium]|nr:DNA repair protein RecO [Patescibacteria group bacterium]MBU1931651.1 DNA repair protein RecO [Patescibacteria group bacterium]
MASYKVNAIVFKSKEIGEADRLLTVFSQHYGKLTLMAKGVRRPISRKAGCLQPFNLVKLVVAKTRTWHIITEAETIQCYTQIVESLSKAGAAYYLAELADQLVPLEQKNEAVFILLKRFFSQLDQGKLYPKDLFNYAFELTQILGFGPPEQVTDLKSLEHYLESVIEKELNSKFLLRQL